MGGFCGDCGRFFDKDEWNVSGSTGPANWAGVRLYECPDCGNKQTRPDEDFDI